MPYYNLEEELTAADLQEFIEKMVKELPPRQQEVFNLSRNAHLTYKEISIRLNISEKTVEYHMGLALKYLRKNLYLLSLFLSV